MNETRVARNELETYLIISAVRRSVRIRSPGRSAYRPATASASAAVSGADDDAVGVEEVLDGPPLLEELGVADDPRRDGPVGERLLQDALDRLAGPDRRRALVDDDRHLAVEGVRDRACRGADVAQVRGPDEGARRVDRQEDELGARDGVVVRRRERQAPVGEVALDELGEPCFADGDVPCAELPDQVGAAVDADDVVTELGEAGSHDEPDMAAADDGDHSMTRFNDPLRG